MFTRFAQFPSPFRWLFVLVLLVPMHAGAASADNDESNSTAEAMAQAIARMMESMGFRDTGSAMRSQSGWPPAFNPWSGAPGMTLPAMPSPTNSPSPAGWGSGAIEGVWEDNQGGLLIVQGSRYRIYSPYQGSVDGSIRVETDRLELTNWSENITQMFEFVIDQDRLALRGTDGQLFVYRRLVLQR